MVYHRLLPGLSPRDNMPMIGSSEPTMRNGRRQCAKQTSAKNKVTFCVYEKESQDTQNHITYSYQMLSSPLSRSACSPPSGTVASALNLAFLAFCPRSHTMFTAAHSTTPTWNASRTLAATVYPGAGDMVPRSHVAKIEPRPEVQSTSAIAVARRTSGAVLFAIHVPSGGAPAKPPGTRRKSEPYRTCRVLAPAETDGNSQMRCSMRAR